MMKRVSTIALFLALALSAAMSQEMAAEVFSGTVKEVTSRIYSLVPINGTYEQGEASGHSVAAYSPEGFLLSLYEYAENGSVLKAEEHVFSGGKNVENRFYQSGMVLYYRSILRYDDRGRLLQVMSYNGAGRLTETMVPGFDPRGNNVSRELSGPDGKVAWRVFSSFDGQDRELSRISYRPNGSFALGYFYEYDDEGRIVEMTESLMEGVATMKIGYSYDGQGRPGGMTRYDAGGNIVWSLKYGYECDSRGNWVKKTAFQPVDGSGGMVWEPQWVEIREISYYD